MLILFSGLPGSGKTTLARACAQSTGALHLNSDVLRRELGLMGHYGPDDKAKVYDALRQRAREALLSGKMVVVDSTFFRDDLREPFRQLARDCHSTYLWVEVQASEAAIFQRLQHPRPDSEADFRVYQSIRDQYEPLSEPHLTVQTDETPLPELVETVRRYVQAHAP